MKKILATVFMVTVFFTVGLGAQTVEVKTELFNSNQKLEIEATLEDLDFLDEASLKVLSDQIKESSPWILDDSSIKIKVIVQTNIAINDNVDRPFLNDEKVIGTWKALDFVDDISDFVPGQKSWRGGLHWKAVEFLSNGRGGGRFGNNERAHIRSNAWTRGFYLEDNGGNDDTASEYKIQNMQGNDYLFIQWKSGDYTRRGDKPSFYVFIRES